ncbi:MAG TPA: hypothetical protein VGK04_08960 [Thermoanaerobaculia bacterium]
MKRSHRCCTYAVALDGEMSDGEIRSVARYLSTLSLAGCEVLIVDNCSPEQFEDHRRVLRWVGRHVAGAFGITVSAAELASCEKVIVAVADSRYTASEVESICELLDRHEVVEPEEYVHPLPWWGAIDAARVLIRRGVDQLPRSTFAFRRSAFRDHGALPGYRAKNVFVRREPPRLASWLKLRPREASADLFFLAFLPLLIVLAVIGGMQVAADGAGLIAFASIGLAVRGRTGARKFFPMRACLYAPLWIAERSLSVYWALFDALRAVPAARLKGMSVGVTTPRETNGSASTIA